VHLAAQMPIEMKKDGPKPVGDIDGSGGYSAH
jgi:hypothetical protein